MNTTSQTRWVVVGVDGSDSSRWALEWSAHEAHLRGLGVRIVTAVTPSEREGPFGELFRRDESAESHRTQDARALVEYARDWVKRLYPELEVDTRLVKQRPADAVLEAAGEPGAAVVIIGSRGMGKLGSAFIGSVGVELAAHSPVPLVVLPKKHEEAQGVKGRIIVGVDGSEGSQRAVDFAFAEAEYRGAELVALCAWQPVSAFTSAMGPLPPEVLDDSRMVEAAQHTLDHALLGPRQSYPDVVVTTRKVCAHPAVALLEESTPADLIVVGSRGKGGFAGLLLGSVSQSVLHGAHGPVAVLR
ncbi:universal stress protein [Salinactinospora qingdaonensis]|uniref:Universal stress protein n=1 Tax=Salinactinospora qingdaonensis TaxID=702744 RepID=A0ABP7FZ57_9ACTN